MVSPELAGDGCYIASPSGQTALPGIVQGGLPAPSLGFDVGEQVGEGLEFDEAVKGEQDGVATVSAKLTVARAKQVTIENWQRPVKTKK